MFIMASDVSSVERIFFGFQISGGEALERAVPLEIVASAPCGYCSFACPPPLRIRLIETAGRLPANKCLVSGVFLLTFNWARLFIYPDFGRFHSYSFCLLLNIYMRFFDK